MYVGPIRTRQLAHALLTAAPSFDAMMAAASALFDHTVPGLAHVVRALASITARGAPLARTDVLAALFSHEKLHSALSRSARFRVVRVPLHALPPRAPRFRTPALHSHDALARALDVAPGVLFSLTRPLRNARTRRAHYHVRLVPKPDGRVRVIEAPPPVVRALQRNALRAILNRVPVHPRAFGFVRGRSVRDFVTPHAQRDFVLRVDLLEFFPSITAARVRAVFRALGYPDRVADTLTALCTHRTPPSAWRALPVTPDPHARYVQRTLYAHPHLPQGAPTSPALANLCAYRLDARLEGLARSAGAQYSRYADDLAFSGDASFARGRASFLQRVRAIVRDEGFRVNESKVRRMYASQRQHLAGVVVNSAPNVSRAQYDALKAQLHNAIVHGPAAANREGVPHLRAALTGRVAWVAQWSEPRGAKLRAMLARVAWDD